MKKTVLTVAMAAGLLISSRSNGQSLVGITDANSVFTMASVSTPSMIGGPYAVSGVASGQTLVAVDTRPGTGELYALGYDSVAIMAQLYKITNVGTVYTATAIGSATSGINLGATNNAAFDFISTIDNQIRIVGRNGNNYVMDANTGLVLSTGGSPMSFAIGDIYVSAGSALAATAYTNSFYGADGTQQVGFDATNNVMVKMDAGNFANGFNNTPVSMHSIGIGTGVLLNTASSVGMDAWYDTLAHNNKIYLTASTLLGSTHLYSYDMSSTTGALADVGVLGGGSMKVRDIAFNTLGASTMSMSGHQVTALSLNMRRLITFDAANPRMLRSSKMLSGMSAGQTMVALDYASNGSLYGLGYNSTAQNYQVYVIDTVTGSVTAVNPTPNSLALGTDDGSGNRVHVAFRFIPTLTNRIRVIGNNGSTNAMIDATTGAVVSTDAGLSYVTGDPNFGGTANLTSVAYTGANGVGATQMFGYDANTGYMVMFNETNGTTGYGIGTSGYINTDANLNTILSLLGHSSTYNNVSMDIAYDKGISTNVGFLSSNYLGDSSDLLNYSMFYDMSSMLSGYAKGTAGAPVTVGRIGYGTPVKDAVLRNSTAAPTRVIASNVPNALPVYPNPVVNNTHVLLPTPSIDVVSVKVIDMNGVTTRSYEYPAGTTSMDVDMMRLPAGIYSVRISGKGMENYNLKVVKQ